MSARWLASATAALTFALMLLGGVVHATGSSLACPDWPTCYGELVPEMVGGILYEHSHRMLGTLVGLFTLVLAVVLFRRGGGLRLIGLGALLLVIVQGLLGGATVLLRLPPAVSTAHLAIAFVFLGTMLLVSTRLVSKRAETEVEVPPRLANVVTLAVVAVFSQCVLGALVRHSGAAAACGADPYACAGSLFPLETLGRIQMLHRFFAVVVALLVVYAAIAVAREPRTRALRPFAFAAVLLVFAQIVLGVLSLTTALDAVMVTAHLAVGALLYGVLLWQRLKMRYPRPESWAAARAPT